MSRSRTSRVAYTSELVSARYEMPSASSARSRNGNEVRGGNRMQTSPSCASRHRWFRRRRDHRPATVRRSRFGSRRRRRRLPAPAAHRAADPARDTPRRATRRPVPRGALPARLEREVLGLRPLGGLDEIAEHVVDPRHHRVGRPEVRREAQRRVGEVVARARGTSRCRPGGTGRSTVSGRRRRTGGPPRPHRVPGLAIDLVVGGREQRGDVDLDRIGVLELVDEQPLVSTAQPAPDGRTVLGIAQHRTCEHEEIVELELAGVTPERRVLRGSSRPGTRRPGAVPASTTSVTDPRRADRRAGRSDRGPR